MYVCKLANMSAMAGDVLARADDVASSSGSSGLGGLSDMPVTGDTIKSRDEEEQKREDDAIARFQDVCQRLNVDAGASEGALELFRIVVNNYSLPGDPLHWIGLALYVSCRLSSVPTVGRTDDVVEGNCVSLTKLLNLCNLSLSGFFNKIKNWMEMTSLPEDFRKKMEKLEKNFFVSAVLFKELNSIFYEIFVRTDSNDAPKPSKSNKRIKSTVCTSDSLFEFTWCLFICVKGEFPSYSDDLVNMYHIFLCCVDLIFGNAFMAQRKDIINPKFEGLPPNWSTQKTKTPDTPPCIISLLCQKYHGSEVDAKSIKQYKFKNVIENFFQKQFLIGDANTFMGLVNPENFNSNLKSLNKMYGTFMLSVGEFDERIILGDNDSDLKITDDEISKAIKLYSANKKNTFFQNTPLTGREHLNHKNDPLSPVSSAFQSLEKLKLFLMDRSNVPSQVLTNIFKECKENPIVLVMNREKSLATQFAVIYSSLCGEDNATTKLRYIEVLYYRLLEDLVKEEKRRKPHIKPQWLFENEMFNKTLFACCVEIILMYNAHSSNIARFPWVLDCFNLDPFHFYKVIEPIVIIIKEKLSRDVVKHLNAIEEHILESLAWKSKGQLWTTIEQLGGTIPGWVEVRSENNASQDSQNKELDKKPQSMTIMNFIQSPNVNFQDRFHTPIIESPAKKQLFKDDVIKPGQSLLSNNNATVSDSEPSTSAETVETTKNVPLPRKPVKGSLGLFFRKFYSLAYIRLQNLCTNLRLDDENVISKIWTLFENGIVQHANLMKDRHLDQILMCTIYVMCKVCNSSNNNVEKTFREIMRCYKLQPQADSGVYRDVLLSSNSPEENGDDDENISPSLMQNRTNNRQKRGDLITFYNSVYIIPMRELVFRISGKTNSPNELSLSPLPEIRSMARNSLSMESHRVSDHHFLYVHNLETGTPSNDCPTYTYCFNRNSTKGIHDINALMTQEVFVGTKRIIQESDGPSAKKILNSLRKCLQ